MLTLYVSLTKTFRSLEAKFFKAAHAAADNARRNAGTVQQSLKDTARHMRNSAAELEIRAENNYLTALADVENRIKALAD